MLITWEGSGHSRPSCRTDSWPPHSLCLKVMVDQRYEITITFILRLISVFSSHNSKELIALCTFTLTLDWQKQLNYQITKNIRSINSDSFIELLFIFFGVYIISLFWKIHLTNVSPRGKLSLLFNNCRGYCSWESLATQAYNIVFCSEGNKK